MSHSWVESIFAQMAKNAFKKKNALTFTTHDKFEYKKESDHKEKKRKRQRERIEEC